MNAASNANISCYLNPEHKNLYKRKNMITQYLLVIIEFSFAPK